MWEDLVIGVMVHVVVDTIFNEMIGKVEAPKIVAGVLKIDKHQSRVHGVECAEGVAAVIETFVVARLKSYVAGTCFR